MKMGKRPHRLKVIRFPLTERTREQWLALRKDDITASVIGALFGAHPYQTIAGLWAEKRGVQFDDEDTSVKRRGRWFEDGVAKAVLEKRPDWKIKKADVYLRAPDIHLGATPDYFIRDQDDKRGCLQIKTLAPVTFRKSWTTDTAPLWIVLQCLTEVMLSRCNFGVIAAMIVDAYRPDLYIYDVPRHDGAERRIQDAVVKFWADMDAGREPQIDYVRDRPLIDLMWPKAQPDKIVDLRSDNQLPALLDERDQLRDAIKQNEARVNTIENEVRFKMGDAEAALVNGFRVTNKNQTREEHLVQKTSFRRLYIAKDREESEAA
jgi:predicted phage-related endonuclease